MEDIVANGRNDIFLMKALLKKLKEDFYKSSLYIEKYSLKNKDDLSQVQLDFYLSLYPEAKKYVEELLTKVTPFLIFDNLVKSHKKNRTILEIFESLNLITQSKCDNCGSRLSNDYLDSDISHNCLFGIRLSKLPESYKDFISIIEDLKLVRVNVAEAGVFNSFDPKFKVIYENRVASQEFTIIIPQVNSEIEARYNLYYSPISDMEWLPLNFLGYCKNCNLISKLENAYTTSITVSEFISKNLYTEDSKNFFEFISSIPELDTITLGSRVDKLNCELGVLLSLLNTFIDYGKNYTYIIFEPPKKYTEEYRILLETLKPFFSSIGLNIVFIRASRPIKNNLISTDELSVESKNTLVFSLEELEKKFLNLRESNIGSYLDCYLPLRKLYSTLPLAKSRGFTAVDFSPKTTRFPCVYCSNLKVTNQKYTVIADCIECNGLEVSSEVTNISFKGLSFKDVLSPSTSLFSLFSFFSFIPLFSQYLIILNELDNIFVSTVFRNSKDKLFQYPLGVKLKILSFNDFLIFNFIKSWPSIIKKKHEVIFSSVLDNYSDIEIYNFIKYLNTKLGPDKALVLKNKKYFTT